MAGMLGKCVLVLSMWTIVRADVVKVEYLGDFFSSDTREKRSVDTGMPDHMSFNFRNNTDEATLNLVRIPDIPMYTYTGGRLKKIVPKHESVAVYKDDLRKSVIKIQKKNSLSDPYEMEGDIEFDDEVYHISPSSSQSTNRGDGQYHTLNHSGKSSPAKTYGKDFRRIVRRNTRGSNSRKKRSIEEHTYTVETCFIIDAEDYSRFYLRNDNDTDKTDSDIHVYYSFIAQQIRLRYDNLYERDPSLIFRIVVSGIVILKNRADSSFLENKKHLENRLDYNLGLDAAGDWLYDHEKELPQSDHYMFFTAYDLTDNGETDSLGLANLGGMCYRDEDGYYLGTSIIENGFDGNVGATAAHELGHSLNADHDSDVGCKDDNLYLMSARSMHPWNITFASNPWKFSVCSVKSIGDFVRTDNVSCLHDKKMSEDVISDAGNIEGQYYDVNDQCKMAFNSDSAFCPNEYAGNEYNETFCYSLYCSTPEQVVCDRIFPRDYTDCGTNKWCYKGLCVPKETATTIKLINVPSTINIIKSSTVVLEKLDYQSNKPTIVIKYHSAFKPLHASVFFNFDQSSGKITVANGAVFNITAITAFVLATDGTTSSRPSSFTINVLDNSQRPNFLQPTFIIDIKEVMVNSVIVSDMLQYVSPGHRGETLLFKILPKDDSDKVSINNSTGQVTLIDKGLSSSITFHVEVSYKDVLKDETTFKITFTESSPSPNIPTTTTSPSPNIPTTTTSTTSLLEEDWFIPVIVAVCVLCVLALIVTWCVWCRRQDQFELRTSKIENPRV